MEDKMKNNEYLIRNFLNLKHSLDVSIESAGGIPLTFEQLDKMTVFELFQLISTNNIRFIYNGDL